MKNLLLFSIGMLAFTVANAQGCLPEGIFFTQAKIDSFQNNYPGCTVIEGDVELGGLMNPVNNLDGLSVLTSIGGDLRIQENWGLTSLSGLRNLTHIGGDLVITRNWNLISLSGLENIISVGGNLQIGYSGLSSGDIISSLAGLGNLATIGGGLWIEGNDSLVNLSGPDNLASVGGDIIIRGNPVLTSLSGLDNINAASAGSLNISDNYSLSTCNVQVICNYLAAPNGTVDIHSNGAGCSNPAEIAGKCGISLPCLPFGNYYFFTQAEIDRFPADYPGCTELQGTVSITGYDIAKLDGMNQVTSIGGTLKIGCYDWGYGLVGNPLLTSISGLKNLTHINGSLWIIYNDTLSSLTGLDSLAFIGGDLWINMGFVHSSKNYHPVLASISALGNLNSIGGELVINSTALQSLSGLENVNTIGGDINISSNAALTTLSGLGNLPFLRGELRISSNGALTTLSGLEKIPSIGGRLYVESNSALSSLTGLEGLHYIGGGLRIDYNDSLKNLTGLTSLNSIVGGIWISRNNNLTNLEGLESLTSIGGGLTIRNSPALTTLKGLDNIKSNSILNIDIFDNISLSACAVKSICDFMVSPDSVIDIRGNAGGCHDITEVKTACDHLSVDDPANDNLLSIYPNPSSDHLTIEASWSSGKSQFSIMNISGKELITRELTGPKTQIDISSLPGGIYFVRIFSEHGVEVRKIIKQ